MRPASMHHDLVRIAHRREPVGDDEGGAAPHQLADGVLHQALGFRIERAGRLVEQQDRRVLQEGAGERDALALAAGEAPAAGADDGVVAVRQPHDEVVRRRGLGRRDDLLVGRVRPAEGDVGPHGVVEQDHVLAHHGDVRGAGSRSVTSPHVLTVDQRRRRRSTS